MSEPVLLALFIAATALAAWFAYRAAKAGEAAIAAKARLEGVDLLRAEHDRAVAERDAARAEAGKMSSELAAERATSAARAEEARKREQALIDMKAEVEKTFQVLAAQALDANQQRFLAIANEAFEKHKAAAQTGVKDVVTPAQEALLKLAGQVEALEKSRTQDKSALNEQMRNIADTLKETQNVTGKLVHALRQSPKARGRWGEHSLRNALEMGGLAPNVDFSEQSMVEGATGNRLHPDVVINLPGGRHIVVDSKVPFSAFLDAMEAPDEAARETLLKKHAVELKAHVKGLSSKEYWKHVSDTVDFVVMFVPGDNLLHEAFVREPELQEEAFASKVIIASPTTMVALARTIAFGWRQEQSAKNAQNIADLGRQLYERLSVMGDHIAKVGDAIDKSVKSYNGLVSSMETRVMVSARKFKELGAADAGVDITEAKQIEAAPRALAPPPEDSASGELQLTPPPDAQSKRRAR